MGKSEGPGKKRRERTREVEERGDGERREGKRKARHGG